MHENNTRSICGLHDWIVWMYMGVTIHMMMAFIGFVLKQKYSATYRSEVKETKRMRMNWKTD